MRQRMGWSAAFLLVFLASGVLAQEYSVELGDVRGEEPDYSPYVDRNYPDRVFWGDTHFHTSNSPDAGLVGNTLGPEEGYRFARGDEVTSSTGLRVKLIRPLDFLVISDHAEYIGLADMLRTSDPALLSDATGKRWHDMYQAGGEQAYAAFVEIVGSATRRDKMLDNKDVERSVWESFTVIADEYNGFGIRQSVLLDDAMSLQKESAGARILTCPQTLGIRNLLDPRAYDGLSPHATRSLTEEGSA